MITHPTGWSSCSISNTSNGGVLTQHTYITREASSGEKTQTHNPFLLMLKFIYAFIDGAWVAYLPCLVTRSITKQLHNWWEVQLSSCSLSTRRRGSRRDYCHIDGTCQVFETIIISSNMCCHPYCWTYGTFVWSLQGDEWYDWSVKAIGWEVELIEWPIEELIWLKCLTKESTKAKKLVDWYSWVLE